MLRRLTVQTRLMLSFGLMALLVALLSGAAWYTTRLQNQSVNRYNHHVVLSMKSGTEAWVAVLQAREQERRLIVHLGDAAKGAAALTQWKAEQARVTALLDDVKQRLIDANSIQQIAFVDNAFKAYATTALPVLERAVAGGFTSAAEVETALAPAAEHLAQGEAKLAEALGTVKNFTQIVMDKLNGLYAAITAAIGVIVTVAIVLVGVLGWRVSRSVVLPLTEATRFADQVGAGDLSARIEPTGSDEATRLHEGLARMRDQLQAMVAHVRTATDGITTASFEIATGNQDLSVRTERTASNLQETASSMETLSSSVRQSADAAVQAQSLATSAASVAHRGGTAVAEVVSTMTEISADSQKIADIVGVIDGIAFQTNILALNAAVEAARAGDQGRGFAVVAGEVRTLAQRSALAAKEIKGLIGASVDKVDRGARLVQDAGSTMSEIVAAVERVTGVISEITATASAQSVGIGQVSSAVSQLDQMTQQNAALVEQSAAAAESMKHQATGLAEVVSRFRLA
ncbi:methyl-accepting chemotaxis protein [Rhizobacter sp. LjRoot28]|uniref:methyl-accepting chemotaxis protein n=1 Tax=Rhizobacter sp. LjRoot28 TaxID=3342309 RepID=UPI003ECE5061